MNNKEYEEQILQWRARKYDDLVKENGWLALAGLHWLKEGRNLVGSNPLCEISLPESAPTFLGVVEKMGRVVRFQAAVGVRVEINGKLSTRAQLKSNQDAHPSYITWNDMRMVLHEYAGKYAIPQLRMIIRWLRSCAPKAPPITSCIRCCFPTMKSTLRASPRAHRAASAMPRSRRSIR